MMWNTVTVNGVEQDQVPESAADHASWETYAGERPLELTLPIAARAQRKATAVDLLARFVRPRSRFSTVTVPTVRYADPYRHNILATDIGSALTVNRTPPGTGYPTPNAQVCTVIGVAHELSVRDIRTSFALQPRD